MRRFFAYLKAFMWKHSRHPVKARLGGRACNRLRRGRNPVRVIEDMEDGFAAFSVAQEG